MTQVEGYWNQEILRYMSIVSPSKAFLKSQQSNDGINVGRNHSDAIGIRPKKRLRRSKDNDMYVRSTIEHDAADICSSVLVPSNCVIGSKGGSEIFSLKEGYLNKDAFMQKQQQNLMIGSQIEVLSQDSGIRGCWFRALIIKKHKDKVKVRYQDIKDAADESINLEEWILASRIAVPDQLGIRCCGRRTIRPTPLSNKGSVSWINVGSVVDAWWHDGWWEGIVLQKGSEDKIHVYFPGEKRQSVFGCSDLRRSEEWLGSGWKQINGRPELVISILSDLATKPVWDESCDINPDQALIFNSDDKELGGRVHKAGLTVCVVEGSNIGGLEIVRDLSKDDLLAQLKWNSWRKRRHVRNPSQKLHSNICKDKSSFELLKAQTCESFFIPSIRDSLFGSAVVSPLTSLVMSR